MLPFESALLSRRSRRHLRQSPDRGGMGEHHIDTAFTGLTSSGGVTVSSKLPAGASSRPSPSQPRDHDSKRVGAAAWRTGAVDHTAPPRPGSRNQPSIAPTSCRYTETPGARWGISSVGDGTTCAPVPSHWIWPANLGETRLRETLQSLAVSLNLVSETISVRSSHRIWSVVLEGTCTSRWWSGRRKQWRCCSARRARVPRWWST